MSNPRGRPRAFPDAVLLRNGLRPCQVQDLELLAQASGASLSGSLDQVQQQILTAARRLLAR